MVDLIKISCPVIHHNPFTLLISSMPPPSSFSPADSPTSTSPTILRHLAILANQQLDPYVYVSLIKACNQFSAFREVKSIHSHVLRLGFDGNLNVVNSLIHFYSSANGFLRYACHLFDRIPERTVVSVNCMISGFFRNERFDLGLGLFNRVLGGSTYSVLKPTFVTLMILVSACIDFGGYNFGRSLHAYSSKMGFGLNVEASNALTDFYAKFGHMDEAARLFDAMSERDLVSWNTLISGYARSNNCAKAFALFREMRYGNIGYDRVSLISMILACANSRNLFTGKVIHGHMLVTGMGITNSIGTVLVNMYSKCGLIEFATRVFDELLHEDIASWNSMIHGFVECGRNSEALGLFKLMLCKKLQPDEVTMLGLISACRNSGEFHNASYIRSYIASSDNLGGSLTLQNALIDMYAKCGSMTQAKTVFDKILKKNVISWTSIIVGHAINGEGEEALAAFQQMLLEKVEPNSITFLGVLLACDHAGLIKEGQKLYDSMRTVYHIEPSIEHCGCMVDMQARAGMLEEAHNFVKNKLIEPNSVIWRMHLNACRVHGKVDMGLSLVSGLKEVKKFPSAEDYVISSNIFAEAGRWEDVVRERNMMAGRKATKITGKSSIIQQIK